MTTPDSGRAIDADRRLLETLQQVLTIQELDVRGALTAACTQVADALAADKVDAFLYEADGEALVALGTSTTEVGHRQHQIGMDHQPLANGGVAVRVFSSGEAYRTGRADQDSDQLRGMVEGLGILSEISVPLNVHGERRGVLSAVSLQPDFFSDADLHFLAAVAGWIAIVAHRGELFEQATREAARRGRREAAHELTKLTNRQREIAIAIAEGLSNEDIAERLVLEAGTVANHVRAVLERLGLRNRTQIGVWAVEHGLYSSDQDQDRDQQGDASGNRGHWPGSSIGQKPNANHTQNGVNTIADAPLIT
jgi:DNA-binding CsgD family transcriptional regulator